MAKGIIRYQHTCVGHYGAITMKNSLSQTYTAKTYLFLLFFIPLLWYWMYSFWIVPSKNYYTNDAQFPYFVNSLAIYNGGSYQYVDHPGTPVEVLGTVLIGITYPFLANAPNGFSFYLLQHPDIFFTTAYVFLIIMHLAAILVFFFTARTLLRLENSLAAAALASMYFAIHIDSLSSSLIWNHNSFGFPFGVLLMLFMVRTLTQAEQHDKTIPVSSLIILGVGAGILTSITFYMISFGIGIIIAVGTYYLFTKKSYLKILLTLIIVGASSIVGFFISILPVLNKMPVFFDWILKIFTHEGKYLAVPENEPTLARIAKNTAGMWENLPALLIAIIVVVLLAAFAIALNRKRLSENIDYWAITLGLSVQTVTLLFILLDRPSRPAYFLSLAATIPVLVFVLLKTLEKHASIYTTIVRAGSLVIFVGIIGTTFHAMQTRQAEIAALNAAQERVSSVVNEYAQKNRRSTEDIVILWMHDTYSACWGLRLGNGKANRIFNAQLDVICKNQYELTRNIRVMMPNKPTILNETNWDIIFTCKQWVDDLLEYDPSLVVKPQPDINWTCGNMVIVTKK